MGYSTGSRHLLKLSQGYEAGSVVLSIAFTAGFLLGVCCGIVGVIFWAAE